MSSMISVRRRRQSKPTVTAPGGLELVSGYWDIPAATYRQKMRGNFVFLSVSIISILVMLNTHFTRDIFWQPPTLRQPSSRRVAPRVIALLDESCDTIIILPHQMTVDDLPMVHTDREVTAQPDAYSLSDYSGKDRLIPYTDGDSCVPMHPWQTTQFPSCNMLHDILSSPAELWYVDEGSQSIVFKVTPTFQNDGGLILKTQLDYESFGATAHEQRRQDAVVQERLTSSPYVMPIYAFCAMSVLSPFATNGSLLDLMRSVQRGEEQEPPPMDKLRIMVQVAEGLAALHDIDNDGRPSVAHNDLDISQHVYHDGIFKLNDFNYGRMLLVDKNNDTCKGKSEMRASMYRSPEELAHIYDTDDKEPFYLDKADVFSMGTEFFTILTNMWPWEGEKNRKSANRLLAGERPPIPSRFLQSTDKAVKAMIKALTMCWKHDPDERATAREVAAFLRDELRKLEDGNSWDGKKDGVVRLQMPPT